MAQRAREWTPDELAEAYIDATADLSFAQTHYADSRITVYLNHLASAIHNEIYQHKHEPRSRFLTFWTHEVPRAMYGARRLLWASFVVFVISAMIGVLSQHIDSDYCRQIMGDSYMDMTEQNIARGTPMGVYGNVPGDAMFVGITTNNVMVSFRVFVSGLLTSIATGFYLLYNGVMIGTFWMYFAQHGLLADCLLATMLHGTLELSAIVVAGCAGLTMGNAWVFPGSYSRLRSLQQGARRGLKIVMGTIPFFVVAGILESYVTRHTAMPLTAKLAIIAVSGALVVAYFVIWPCILHRKEMSATPQTSNDINHKTLFDDENNTKDSPV